MMQWHEQDAPLLIVMGQSNAHGHGTALAPHERIKTPLTRVLGLARAQNQQFGLREVTWSGFQSGGMNLGETQDDTVCLAESFARLWQARADAGQALPVLRIIQISIGSQGVAPQERDGLNMWARDRAPVLQPGPLATVNISLYPLAVQTLSLAVQTLKKQGKRPVVLGLHWNQWETEVYSGGQTLLAAPGHYKAMFEGFAAALGGAYPLWLYEPLSYVYNNDAGLAWMHAQFTQWSTHPHVHLMRTSQSPFYTGGTGMQGIFQPDNVHYTPAVQRWFASEQERAIFEEA